MSWGTGEPWPRHPGLRNAALLPRCWVMVKNAQPYRDYFKGDPHAALLWAAQVNGFADITPQAPEFGNAMLLLAILWAPTTSKAATAA